MHFTYHLFIWRNLLRCSCVSFSFPFSLSPSFVIQMLIRGANAVGYTSYPDNVVAGV